MKDIKARKILLPIDGSRRSFDTIRRFATMHPFRKHTVVLFHVFNGIPEYYLDIGKESQSVKIIPEVRAWENNQRNQIKAAMDKAHRLLLQSGFSKESVKVIIQDRKRGIARDIIHEAHDRYSAVVIRRRGKGALRSLVLGSVATKLIQSITFVPLLIIGKQKLTGRLLIVVDGSPGARRAVDFVADFQGGYDFDVHLVHVIRENITIGPTQPNLANPLESQEVETARAKEIFKVASKRLVAGGFSYNQISEKIITSATSRSMAITELARKEGIDTIILGRQGVSQSSSFVIGRVANKVIHMARQCSVWVIN